MIYRKGDGGVERVFRVFFERRVVVVVWLMMMCVNVE